MPKEPVATTTGTQTLNDSLLDRIVATMSVSGSSDDKTHAHQMLQVFAEEVESHKVHADTNMLTTISERIKALDDQIHAQLNLILHAEPFQKLEASWRGLHQLVSNTETGTSLKLRLLNVGKEELANDLKKAVEFDQSVLFKKVYEEEYGTFGGSPFSLLMGDYEFGRSAPDIDMLTSLSNVAAAAHAPLITAASPQLFDLKSFADLGVPRDLAKTFESTSLVKWNKFRESEDSRYVSMVLPHYLARLPYDPENAPVPTMLNFAESVHEGDDFIAFDPNDGRELKASEKGLKTDPKKFLWGNASWLLTQRITDAFAKHRWCAAIRGPEGGGTVSDLPLYQFLTPSGDLALNCPTEVAITDRREKELDSLGFIALCHRKNSNDAVFFGGQTTNKPKTYNTFEANANARISGMLPYVLAASRFAHYLKVILRDKVGTFATRENVQSYLNNWITDYVLINDNAPQEIKAQYPLREARIDVTDVPGRPGSYRATVFLRPHFQLEELTASIRLVATLPPSAAA
ncbi:type VI secretion system contractile sheath large subunit [Pseudomonas sp. LJDD11]|uniref:type VI secretion system contractile sheath large subunit n=1 Tax=unclassified Pseudomonas TaxID=196821 RepID=UPI0004F910E2|nr:MULTISPECIES: type VI secretion system contractile sheath large subunit [unclassified Pseudomonas]MCQ9422897.1 type VI secretion system contractile sheath large subunit [Pseudomonas sp. LJDD11]BAP45288.1 EvpB family type VI secretion protein [Pseudomonas sp. StFLB209]